MRKIDRKTWNSTRKSAVRSAFCAMLAAGLMFGATDARAQDLSASKEICAGVPDAVTPATLNNPGPNDPRYCAPAPFISAGQPAFYVIRVTYPPSGTLPQQITLTESSVGGSNGWPNGFTPTAVTCTDDATGNPVTVSGFSSPLDSSATVGSFWIAPLGTVTCTVEGSFSSSAVGADIQNVTNVSNGLVARPVDASVHVVNTPNPLNADLEVLKSVSPTSIDVSSGAQTVTYTVTVTNNGPASVDVGHWFQLHDNLRLPPNGVPLFATIVQGSFACSVTGTTPASDCLDASTLNAMTWTQQLIGTMAPHPMFTWSFPSVSQGHLEPNAVMTLSWQVTVEELNGLDCYKALNSDGLRNVAFFTLTNPDGTAVNDDDNSNNTAAADLEVITGNTVLNPDCGAGQMKIDKTQIYPTPAFKPGADGMTPATPMAWGAGIIGGNGAGYVVYSIRVQNTSIPAQPIVINGGDIEDHVVNGIGTPPFTRFLLGSACVPGDSSPGLCSIWGSGNSGGTPPPPAPYAGSLATAFKYTAYGEWNLGWETKATNSVTLLPGQFITVIVGFNYADPDCDTVPVVNPKPIENVGLIRYVATPLGGTYGSSADQTVQYLQTDKATTYMQPTKACKFRVRKWITGGGPNLQFGVPLTYKVWFTNGDASRPIGTVMDALRVTDLAYAAPLPFVASWSCSNSATGFSQSGVVLGQVGFANTPAQGSPVFAIANASFPSGSTLKCDVTVTVERPKFGNTRCSALPTDLENMGLMDTTQPYNTNVPWPPSGAYTATASEPAPNQNRNWATVRTPLPQCYDAIIEKEASVNGLSPAWTWAGGSNIDYTIKVTNTADNGALTGSGSWDGLVATDNVSSPYAGNLVMAGSAGICTLSAWCQPFNPPPTSPSPSSAGVANLAAGASGDWNLTLQGPFTTGQAVKNCATISPKGGMAGPDWYSNYDPATPPKSCEEVPVLDVRDVKVKKIIENQTGSSISLPGLSFGVSIACTPWPLPPTSSTISAGSAVVANGGSVGGGAWTVSNVPVGDSCTVTETSQPQIPSSAHCSVNGVAGTVYWDTAVVSPQPLAVSATGPNEVIVTNVLRCEAPPPPTDCCCCEHEEECLFELKNPFFDAPTLCVTFDMLCCLLTLILLFMILMAVSRTTWDRLMIWVFVGLILLLILLTFLF
ncbi:MAG: DUF5979 domain-containing protein [Parvularculaceae bacterium]